jgi:hypothetical protein
MVMFDSPCNLDRDFGMYRLFCEVRLLEPEEHSRILHRSVNKSELSLGA